MQRETRRATARIFARANVGRGMNPSSHPMAANGSRLVSEPTPLSKARCLDVGNDPLIAMTHLCARQSLEAGRIASRILTRAKRGCMNICTQHPSDNGGLDGIIGLAPVIAPNDQRSFNCLQVVA